MLIRTICGRTPSLRRTRCSSRPSPGWSWPRYGAGGLLASVDGLRFVVPSRTINAAPSPKFFGYKRGLTWLNAVNDQVMGIGALIVPGIFSSHPVGCLHVCHEQPPPSWGRCSLWSVGHGAHVVDGAGFGFVLGVEDGGAGGWKRWLDRGG